MPIYAYQCESCGFAKDVLQKLLDSPLTVCPDCGEATFKKQVTAAGFHLKGSGWYATDFKNGSAATPETAPKAPDPSAAPGSDKTPPRADASPAPGGCCAGCSCHQG